MNPVGLLVGFVFGFVIVAARLNEDTVIHNMLLLRDPDPYLVMGSAILVAWPLLRLLRARKWRAPLGTPGAEVVAFAPQPVRRHHVHGALLFGAGWAVSGTCPVPALGMVATGNALGLLVVAGLLAGIVLRDAVVASGNRGAAASGLAASG